MKTKTKKRLVVLDTHAIIHRAYHALPDFATHDGRPTGALYGLCTMVIKIISELKPDYIISAYDLPEKTFRHEAYDAYKGKREKTDDALISQLNESRDIISAFGIPILDAPGFEADDVLGTVVDKLKKDKNVEIVIASGDMDTLQLVDNEKVFVYTLKKTLNDTILYNEQAVIDRYGFEPKYIPDYKGLRGDTSDNIVGIKGIGEKTATILIQAFGSIENMYKSLSKSELDFREKTGLTDRLIGLIRDNQEEAIFSKTLATIRVDAPVDFDLNDCDFRKNIDIEKLKQVFIKNEFKSLVQKIDLIKNGNTEVLSKNTETQTSDSKKTIHIEKPVPEDFKIMTSLIYSDYVDPEWSQVFEVAGTDEESLVKEKLLIRMKSEDVFNVYEYIEKPLFKIVKKMEDNGIKIDIDFLKKMSETYHSELSLVESKIFSIVGREFNLNSPKQISEVLFDDLKLNEKVKIKKSAGGKLSTRESELEKMRDLHPIIPLVLEYREIQKLLSTYVDVLPNLIHEDGRIHATFNQIGAVTGRFSSKNPNLQNIPIKTERGSLIRKAFVAEKGYSLVVLDYAQVELRLAAFFSQDESLLNAFNQGKDIHTVVAAKVFKVEENLVTKEMRRKAKTINFGILYGMGVNALKEGLGSSRQEAQDFYDAYYSEFKTLSDYLESVKDFARTNGFTRTLFGRKRIFNGIKSKMQFVRAQAERMAINAPIQGTQADMTKLAMISVDGLINKKYNDQDVKIVLQIHDELVYEVKDEIANSFMLDAILKMSSVVPDEFMKGKIPVKFEVSGGIAKDWGSVK